MTLVVIVGINLIHPSRQGTSLRGFAFTYIGGPVVLNVLNVSAHSNVLVGFLSAVRTSFRAVQSFLTLIFGPLDSSERARVMMCDPLQIYNQIASGAYLGRRLARVS